METFLYFLRELRSHSLSYTLDSIRPEPVMVTVNVPGHRIEVEFFNDGHVEVERFTSPGEIEGEEGLSRILSEFGELDSEPHS